MWKWLGVIIALFALILGVGWWQRDAVLGLVREYQARRLIYDDYVIITKYPGAGEKIFTRENDEYLVEPKGIGAPFFLDATGDLSKYPTSEYKLTMLPAQDELLYVVGRVRGWESIEGSSDKYLVLDSGQKYRLGFAISALYGYEMEDVTVLMVEDVSKRMDEAKNKVHKLESGKLSTLGYDKVKKVIRRGDSVVLIPVFAPPEWSRRDESGNYVIAQIIVRRSGGEL